MAEIVTIGGRKVGKGHPPYIIAEACINHEGDIKIARQMVYVAHAMGADCIKFQIHILENEMLRRAPQSKNFDAPLWDTLERTNLSITEHRELKSLCQTVGIDYLCTPFSRDGADILEKEIGVDFYKLGSGEMTNHPLVEHVARKGKPIIISSGMCEVEEVLETVDVVKRIGTPLILTHCVSAYPTPYHLVNLGMIPKYRQLFGIPVGLSDHSQGIYTALGSVALEACLIEKHFTLDKMQKGPDHASSIEPYELGELVKGAKAVFNALGSEKHVFQEEREIVAWARESVVSEQAIKAGTRITESMVWVKRPSPAPGVVAAKDLRCVIGAVAAVDIPTDIQIKWSMLEK